MRKHLRILSSILSAAVEDELIAVNPALGVRRRRRSRQHEAKRQIDPLTREELTRLLEAARTYTIQRGATTVYPFRRSYPFLLTLARAGLRLGEAVALRWGDIDWQGRFIFVQRAYVRGVLAETKSGKTRRVYMSEQLTTVLRDLYAERFERVVAIDAEGQVALEEERAKAMGAWVFPSDSGGLLDKSNFRKRVFNAAPGSRTAAKDSAARLAPRLREPAPRRRQGTALRPAAAWAPQSGIHARGVRAPHPEGQAL